MSRQTPILEKTFCADTAIASANLCVVASGVAEGNVALPGGALATKFVGVTLEAVQSGSKTNAIGVQVAGIAQIQTDGSASINSGDYVAIANSGGQIKTVAPAAGTNARQVVGVALSSASNVAGLLVDVLLQPMVYIGA